ncbi:sensor domain-containing phosphodiesterase [Gilvimarinus sp. F26214L]|uniref:sensor domain-containing phosphodiesterase n=1 Tax=Gilvimarinus sp. DZF01 TaxID=3461371 RepID=UPI0040458807
MEPRHTTASDSSEPLTGDLEEHERLDDLHRLCALNEASESRLDHYTSLIAEIFGFPVVLVSFVDQDKEWFKSAYGFEASEVKRDISFCAHAITYKEIMVIPDARADSRFANNPLVTGPPHIRFYAGAVIRSSNGHPLGTLCLIDYRTREFGRREQQRLLKFAELLESDINATYELESLRQSIEHSAFFDPLTWLPNRRLFIRRLDSMLEQARERALQVPLVLFSVSRLRLINQAFGTQIGDSLLHEVGDRLIACCPPDGFVAHVQADEFVVAFPAEKDALEAFLSAARTLLRRPFNLENEDIHLEIRAGGSSFPDHGRSPADLLERASAALRAPGEDLRQSVAVFNENEALGEAERLAVESMLRKAIDERRFHLVYQPVVSLRSRTTAYVEALIRWDDSELSTRDTCQLIRICEENGLIHQLGDGIQDLACTQCLRWQSVGNDIPFALNVSTRELEQADFASRLLHRLEQSSIHGSMLSIELTEYAIAGDDPNIFDNIRTLRLASVRVNVDDFGTGYSALGYLSRIPVSGLKVDRSFIAGLPQNRRQATLTLAILGVADALDLTTVAEGVETREQLEFLQRTNCRYAQGFCLSKPVEADDIPRLWGHPLF